MMVICNQLSRLKGGNSCLLDLQGVLRRVLNYLKMTQGPWLLELWKKSQNNNQNKGRERSSDLSEGRGGGERCEDESQQAGSLVWVRHEWTKNGQTCQGDVRALHYS
jgi:hypothetical protein